MNVINMNEKWTFRKIDTNLSQIVTLPFDAMFHEQRNMHNLSKKNGAWFAGGDYVFEKEIFFDETYRNKKVYLEFESVYHNSVIYFNDKKIYERPYGYTNFFIEIQDYILMNQDNKIKVIAHNSDQPNSRWYAGGGILRPVNLHVFNKKHILLNSIKVTTLDHLTKSFNVEFETSHQGRATIQIANNDEIIYEVTTEVDLFFNQDFVVSQLELWSAEDPNIYQVIISFEGDVQKVNFGLRTISYNTTEGFLINGNRVILKGACIHHDNGILGAVAHPYAEYRKVKILKDSGYNAIRSAHNPSSKSLIDACDKLGMYLLDEYVDMWYIHKTPYDYASYMKDWWQQDLIDMIQKDYNHPSVIMYSIGNEVAETSQQRGIDLTEQMTKFIHLYDQRPVTCGINVFFNYLFSLGFGVYSDDKAKKQTKNKKHKSVGSEFFNDLAGLFGDKTMKIGAWMQGSDRKTKDAFSKLDIAGYNYGILRYKKDIKKYPNRMILGTETFCKDASKFYEIAKKNPTIVGDFVWAGMDYIGEVGIGSWEYKDYAPSFDHGPGWITAGSGRIDLNGFENAEMAYTRVAFDLDQIRMAVVPVKYYKEKHSPSAWKLSNAIESWSWHGCENNKTSVEVYTKAHSVALFVNSQKITSKKVPSGNIVKFKVKYQPGTITAIGFDKQKNELFRTNLTTAEKETQISLHPFEESITVDDLCYVKIQITDKNNVLKPLEKEKIQIKVDNGELIALGHACPFNDEGYHSDTTSTYYGQALAIIKPKKEGLINIESQSIYGRSNIKVIVKDLI